MSAIREYMEVKLNQKQVRKIASMWRRHENPPGRAMICIQPRLNGLYSSGILQVVVVDYRLAKAIRSTVTKHKKARP